MNPLLAWLESLRPSTRRSARVADSYAEEEPTLQPATDDDTADDTAMHLWTPPDTQHLTLRSAACHVDCEAQSWPLLFRDSMGRLHLVREVVVAPRPAKVILEANPLP